MAAMIHNRAIGNFGILRIVSQQHSQAPIAMYNTRIAKVHRTDCEPNYSDEIWYTILVVIERSNFFVLLLNSLLKV